MSRIFPVSNQESPQSRRMPTREEEYVVASFRDRREAKSGVVPPLPPMSGGWHRWWEVKPSFYIRIRPFHFFSCLWSTQGKADHQPKIGVESFKYCFPENSRKKINFSARYFGCEQIFGLPGSGRGLKCQIHHSYCLCMGQIHQNCYQLKTQVVKCIIITTNWATALFSRRPVQHNWKFLAGNCFVAASLLHDGKRARAHPSMCIWGISMEGSDEVRVDFT